MNFMQIRRVVYGQRQKKSLLPSTQRRISHQSFNTIIVHELLYVPVAPPEQFQEMTGKLGSNNFSPFRNLSDDQAIAIRRRQRGGWWQGLGGQVIVQPSNIQQSDDGTRYDPG